MKKLSEEETIKLILESKSCPRGISCDRGCFYAKDGCNGLEGSCTIPGKTGTDVFNHAKKREKLLEILKI